MASEEHPVLKVLALLVAGFGAGFGAYHALIEAIDIRSSAMKAKYEEQIAVGRQQAEALSRQAAELQKKLEECGDSKGDIERSTDRRFCQELQVVIDAEPGQFRSLRSKAGDASPVFGTVTLEGTASCIASVGEVLYACHTTETNSRGKNRESYDALKMRIRDCLSGWAEIRGEAKKKDYSSEMTVFRNNKSMAVGLSESLSKEGEWSVIISAYKYQ